MWLLKISILSCKIKQDAQLAQGVLCERVFKACEFDQPALLSPIPLLFFASFFARAPLSQAKRSYTGRSRRSFVGPWFLRRLELLAMGKKQARQYSWVQSNYLATALVNDHLCYATVLCFMWQLMCFLFYIVGVWCVVYRNKLEREQEYYRSLYWAGKVSFAFLWTIFLPNNNRFTYRSFYPSLFQVLRLWEWRESERQAKIRAHDLRTRLYCSLEQATFTQAGNRVALTLISPVCWCVLF